MPQQYNLIFTQLAENEIYNIYSHIFIDNPYNAENWILKLHKACHDLCIFPNKYPLFKNTRISTRQMIFNKNIRIIYHIDSASNSIIITHCYRCEQNIFI